MIWKVHRPSITLRPTSSCSIRSASSVCPASRSRSHGLAELQVGAAGELVEGVEVAAGALGGLQRLGELADGVDGSVVHAASFTRRAPPHTPGRTLLRMVRAPVRLWRARVRVEPGERGRHHSGRSTGMKKLLGGVVDRLRAVLPADAAAVGGRGRARARAGSSVTRSTRRSPSSTRCSTDPCSGGLRRVRDGRVRRRLLRDDDAREDIVDEVHHHWVVLHRADDRAGRVASRCSTCSWSPRRRSAGCCSS